MLVDPKILRAFAGSVDHASSLVHDADVGKKVTTAADGLNGSATQWAARTIGANVSTAFDKIADGLKREAAAVRGTGDTFQVKDEDLAGTFKTLWPR
ncbi:hypothetical protein MLB1_21395 [Mycobacteroides sp. LB1]|nr:hypothetical protein [Mycobacteroides sp. LB1]